jgi:hypothetical protein
MLARNLNEVSLMDLAPIFKGVYLREDPELQGIRKEDMNPMGDLLSTTIDNGVRKDLHHRI